MSSLAAKIGQLMIVGFEGLAPPPRILAWLARGRIGGIALFARNIESPAQVRRLIAECRAAAEQPILVSVDQEGGAVARLRNGFSESPGAMALGAGGDRQRAEDIAFMLGSEMAAVGVNWNFAPVADIARQSGNPSVGTRSVGRDPRLVSEMVVAQIRGFQRSGVAATVKHFPGLGNTVVDTHDGPASVRGSLSYLNDEDLHPFRKAIAADVGFVMLTHVLYEELDGEFPATLSPRIVDGLLRQELGYHGAVCTDCMEMKAITDAFGAGESAVLALQAGVDMVLFSHTRAAQEEAYRALQHAAETGRLSAERINQSMSRVQELKSRFALDKAPPLEVVGCEAHRSLAGEAARAGTVRVTQGSALPLPASVEHVALIEFSSQRITGGGAAHDRSRIAAFLSNRLPTLASHIVDPAADFAANCEALSGVWTRKGIVILVTRNAHMQPAQLRLARFICDRAQALGV